MIAKQKRSIQEILNDYKIVNESVEFIGERIDGLCSKHDYLEDSNASDDVVLSVCNQIKHLYGKLQSESELLERLAAELTQHGYKI